MIIRRKSLIITQAVNNPKPFMAVIGLVILARKDIAVVAVVTNIALPALLKVQDKR